MELLQQHLSRLHRVLRETLDYVYAFSTYIFGDQAHPGAEDHGRSRENNHSDGLPTDHDGGEDPKHYGQEAPGGQCEEAGHPAPQVPSAATDPACQESKGVLRTSQDTPQPQQSGPRAVSLEARSREPTSLEGQAPPHSQALSPPTLPLARAGEHEDEEFRESSTGLEAQMKGRERAEEGVLHGGREGNCGSGSFWQGEVRRGSPTPYLRAEGDWDPEGGSPMEWELRGGSLWLGDQREEGDLEGSYTQGRGEGGHGEQREKSPQQGTQGEGEEVDPMEVSAWLGCQREEARGELGTRDRGHSLQADNGEGQQERGGDIWRDSSWPGTQSEGEGEGCRERGAWGSSSQPRTQTEEGEGGWWGGHRRLEGQGEGKGGLQLGASISKCEEGTKEQEPGGVSAWLEEGPKGSHPQAEDGAGPQKAEGEHWGGSAWLGVQGGGEEVGVDERSGVDSVCIGDEGLMKGERELREEGGPVAVEGEPSERMEEQVRSEGKPREEGEPGKGEGERWEDRESLRGDGEPREESSVEGESRGGSPQLQSHGEQEEEMTEGGTWEGEPRNEGGPGMGDGEFRSEETCWGEEEFISRDMEPRKEGGFLRGEEPREEGGPGRREGEIGWEGESMRGAGEPRAEGESREKRRSVGEEGGPGRWDGESMREETGEGEPTGDGPQPQSHGEQEEEMTEGGTWEGEPRNEGGPGMGDGEFRSEETCWGGEEFMSRDMEPRKEGGFLRGEEPREEGGPGRWDGESMREDGEPRQEETGKGEPTGDGPQPQSHGEQEVEEVPGGDISPPGRPMEHESPGRSTTWLETQKEGEGEHEGSCPQGVEGSGDGSICYGALGESSANHPHPLSTAPHSDLPDATQTHLLEPGKVFPLDVSAQRSRVQLRRKGSARRAPSLRVQRPPAGALYGQPTTETSPQLPEDQRPPAIILPPMPSQSQMPRRQFPGPAGFGLAHPHMMAELKFRLRKPTPQ